MNIRLLIILGLAFLCLPVIVYGQNYSMNGTPINDCSGTFFDSGGETGNYTDNQTLSTTICSDGSNGTHIRLSFSGTDIAPGDQLCFYDGVDLTAPLLSCHTDYNPGQPFLIQATAVNPSGCLTVSFVSNGSGNGTGWAAAIACVPSCQSILADLVSTNPAGVPADTGWIDICPGERVFFNGVGIYPQNNFAYQQSDLTTTFEWNFGDGGIAYGPNTSHRFDEPGGYYVQLFLTDTQGCRNTNLINQRIRVAPRPTFSLLTALDQTICAGDTLQLSASISGDSSNLLLVTPNASSFEVEGSRSDSLALPDGTGIPYETSIFFTEFSPGQVLTSANDLESICVTIEHSYVRDVEITLTCPNGQSIILHDHPGNFGGAVFLGEPNDNDNVNPIPGLGYDYCWINNAPNPTWITYANTVLPGGSGTIPPGDYSTYDPISDLVGCPLNGEWTIAVTDWWPIDNGFIFNWSLKFKDELYPNIEQFTPQITSWAWNNHPSIFFSTPDSIAASPQNAGTAGYRFTVQDEFGCSWDTLLTIAVLPPTHPNCHQCTPNQPVLQDTSICSGNSVQLNASTIAPPPQEVRFEAYPDYRLGNGNHPHNNPYYSPVSVSSLGFNLLNLPVQQITSVCMDIETDYASDLQIYLQAPSGQLLELSTGNGGSGDNYKITCFSPSATVPIVGQAAPFNGTYRPEGNWNAIQGTGVNGNWSLRVSDGFAPNQYGKVKWWSIGFNVNNTVNYVWPNATGLSCANCPNPTATPAATSIYTVQAQDAFGCVYRDTVQIGVSNFFPPPGGLMVISLGNGTMTWGWDPLPGASGYEVSIDGGPWIPSNSGAAHQLTGLTIGQTVEISVRAISQGCTPQVSTASSTFVNCTLATILDAIGQTNCAGDSTGTVDIGVMGGTMPYTFIVNDWPGTYASGNLFQIFPEGNHTVVVRDLSGCTDTLNFNIQSPPPMQVQSTTIDVDCAGLDNGEATATTTGGFGIVNFSWQHCSGGPTIPNATAANLLAGCYIVTATDENGCQAFDTVTINEPLPFSFDVAETPVSCNGGDNGTAVVTVSGATQPYTYLWDNGQTDSTSTGLDAGIHFVTITDGNLCQAATYAEITEPALLSADSTSTINATCFGGSNGAAHVHVSGGTQPYGYLWSNMQTTQNALNVAAGTYTVTVTDALGCTALAVALVEQNPDLTAVFSAVISEACAGDCQGQADVTAAGGTPPYVYQWSAPNIPNSSNIAASLCPGVYQVTVQDFYGCTETQSATIAPATPIATAYNLTAPACAGIANGAVNTVVSGGTGALQFLWSNGATTASVQNLACGTHFLTITDAAGCIRIDTIVLDCPTTVNLSAPTVTAVTCFGQSNGTATITPNGGQAPYTFLWNDANAQIGQQATNLPAGAYQVTVTDQNGCTATAAATVTQPPLLAVTATATAANCFGDNSGAANAIPNGGTAPYQFAWSNGFSTQQVSSLFAGNYTVTVSDNNSCTAAATINISQPAQGITVTATQLQPACFAGQNGIAQASATGGNGAPFNYAWSNNQNTATANNLAPGQYTVTASDQLGCTGSQSVVIQSLAEVLVNVAFVPPTCFGAADAQAAVNLISGGAGMGDTALYHYQWSKPNSPDAASVNGLAGDQTYQLTVSDDLGCTGSYSFYVNEPPAIVFNTNFEAVTCFGYADGSASVSNVTNASGQVSYLWSNSGTSAQTTQLIAGSYTVTVTDAKGCTSEKTLEIPEPTPLVLSFDIQPLICASDSNAAITALIGGGTPAYQFNWSNGQTTDRINQLRAGTYNLTVTDQNGCSISGAQTIELPEALTAQVEHEEPECYGERNGRIRLIVSGGTIPFRYSLNGSPFEGGNTFLALGAGIYQLQVRDANGCLLSLTDTLPQPPAIEVTLPTDTTLVFGDSLLISSQYSNVIGMPEFEWDALLADSFTCIDPVFCDEIWIKPIISNTFQLTVSDEKGCSGTAAIKVKVLKPRGVYVPTGFSPNGDLSNDLLIVHGLSRQVETILMFRVYDRWGELVYEDRDFPVNEPNRGWDGRFREQQCDPGVYVWMLEVRYKDGHQEVLKGDVTLIR